VSIKHAVEAEVRLYDRLFIDEARTAIKKKLLEFKIQIGNCERLRRTKFSFSLAGDKFQFQRLGYFNTDKDSMPGKLVLIKQLD
jgi:glutaminyl-tRNA synthetase